jgi:hypothetical protein
MTHGDRPATERPRWWSRETSKITSVGIAPITRAEHPGSVAARKLGATEPVGGRRRSLIQFIEGTTGFRFLKI